MRLPHNPTTPPVYLTTITEHALGDQCPQVCIQVVKGSGPLQRACGQVRLTPPVTDPPSVISLQSVWGPHPSWLHIPAPHIGPITCTHTCR